MAKYIMLHGLGQTAQSWDKTLSFLPSDTDVSCPKLYDFFGADERTYCKLYGGLCEYLGSFSEQVTLCGLSLGAVLALNYAEDFPQNVRSLILIAPQYKMPKSLLKMQNIIFGFMPESAFAETGLSKSDFISLTSSMTDIDLSGSIGNVRCPVTVICGERDRANRKAAKTLADIIPDAEYIVIPNAGHEVNNDEPQKLAEVIVRKG
ncbi:MAG: alpha/beta fold hydrolase [Oscillospiraceae bacterium]